MKLPQINSLYFRIFAIFWLTVMLVLAAFMLVQHKDPRKTHTIPKERLLYLQHFVETLELQFKDETDLDIVIDRVDRFARKRNEWKNSRKHNDDKSRDDWYKDRKNSDYNEHFKHKVKDYKRFELFIVNKQGQLLTGHHSAFSSKAIRHFVASFQTAGDAREGDAAIVGRSTSLSLATEQSMPQQRLYRRFMISGPFKAKLADTNVQIYVATKWQTPPKIMLLLLDKPISALFIIMLISTPILLWLSWSLSLPARRLEKAANRVAVGEFMTDPSLEKGSHEFRAAGKSFNQMVSAINHTVTAQHRLLSDISHELRSPLARLRMAAALAKRKQGESGELSRIEKEAEELERMIAELLTLSRLQAEGEESKTDLSLYSLFTQLLSNAKFEAEQIDKSLSYNAVPSGHIFGAEKLLQSAVENVIRNAIYFAKSRVNIEFSRHAKQLILVIEDDGEGVPASEFKAIFQPFYRVSEARDRQSGGTGLGLAIAESAITQHHGTIAASKSALGGLKVTINLPLTDNHK